MQTAPFIGELIAEKGWQPDEILSSPAERAKQTATLAKQAGHLSAKLNFDEKIYEASHFQLRDVIQGVSDKVERLLLVGHNPGLENLVRFLTGEMHSVPTAALIKITLTVDSWSETEEGRGKLDDFIKPKDEMGP
jgi:phosphohistidine phosphatase